ncbi:MAG TPA: Rv2175c family DNA-binding protein [Cellulomonadaceae bacterium]|nr:Rv2175c family DNA-binding protein [Cellulomonadaceae bacterium]
MSSDSIDAQQSLDGLVGAWLTVPDVAERLGIDAGKVRRLIQERKLLAVRRGEPPVVSVPADFLVPEHLANPANVQAPTSGASPSAILSSLAGTLSILGDVGFSDAEAVRWLFTQDDALQATPLAALRTGRKTEVRRRAQLEL